MNANTYNTHTSDCLFQKLGNTWYVFAEIDNDILFSPLPDGITPNSHKLELFEVVEKFISKAKANRALEATI